MTESSDDYWRAGQEKSIAVCHPWLGLRSDTKMPRLDMLRLQEGAEIVTVTKVHPAQTLAFL
jgi:hypothetical protein